MKAQETKSSSSCVSTGKLADGEGCVWCSPHGAHLSPPGALLRRFDRALGSRGGVARTISPARQRRQVRFCTRADQIIVVGRGNAASELLLVRDSQIEKL